MSNVIAVIGIGYVGLQNAISIANAGLKVIAFDIDSERIRELQNGIDRNYETVDLSNSNLIFTDKTDSLIQAHYYLICIPTPINEHLVPNIFPLKNASKMVGEFLSKGNVVVLESTVFPGATRELMIPVLEQQSGLISGVDFFVGYSSERINPGDSGNNLSNTTKVISGQNDDSLQQIKSLYELFITLNLHCAPSMEVAESSKLLENIQRDVNVALMNEFAQIMDKVGISIRDVLAAAKTKWNFLPFSPGLVGGHCIPEDPYYLIYQANKLGALPNIVSCARQVNEQFFHFIIDVTVRLLTQEGHALKYSKIAIMGISFKENVTDTRHSMSIVLYKHLKAMGLDVVACDPVANHHNKELDWIDLNDLTDCHAMIFCKAHKQFLDSSAENLSTKIVPNGIVIDIPGAFLSKFVVRKDITYWGL